MYIHVLRYACIPSGGGCLCSITFLSFNATPHQPHSAYSEQIFSICGELKDIIGLNEVLKANRMLLWVNLSGRKTCETTNSTIFSLDSYLSVYCLRLCCEVLVKSSLLFLLNIGAESDRNSLWDNLHNSIFHVCIVCWTVCSL